MIKACSSFAEVLHPRILRLWSRVITLWGVPRLVLVRPNWESLAVLTRDHHIHSGWIFLIILQMMLHIHCLIKGGPLIKLGGRVDNGLKCLLGSSNVITPRVIKSLCEKLILYGKWGACKSHRGRSTSRSWLIDGWYTLMALLFLNHVKNRGCSTSLSGLRFRSDCCWCWRARILILSREFAAPNHEVTLSQQHSRGIIHSGSGCISGGQGEQLCLNECCPSRWRLAMSPRRFVVPRIVWFQLCLIWVAHEFWY